MKNNNEIFEDFWNSFNWPDPVTLSYRLYYDDSGNPIVYSTEDLDYKYIEVTPEQYALNNYNIVIRNNQIIDKTNFIITTKLVPSTSGTPCDPTDVTVVVTNSQAKHWILKHYDNS